MNLPRMPRRAPRALALSLLLAAGAAPAARAQNTHASQHTPPPQQQAEEENTRQIQYSGFANKRRPAASAPSAPKSSGGAKKPAATGAGDSAAWNTYKVVKPPAPVRPVKPKAKPAPSQPSHTAHKPKPSKTSKTTKTQPAAVETLRDVGITLWRLRPARETDNTDLGFQVVQDGKPVLLVPERLSGTAPVSLGEHVRISIESPTDGYLYVINREQYSDGTTGPATLIFPVTRTHGGDNRVFAGRLIDIPGPQDRPPFFTLTTQQVAGQPHNVGELITVLITPRPIEGITPGPRPVSLSPEQFARWEGDWEGEVRELLEMSGGAGRTWTMEEKQASEATRSLTQVDPTPQTIYRVAARANEPLMVTVQMLYGAAAPTQAAAPSEP